MNSSQSPREVQVGCLESVDVIFCITWFGDGLERDDPGEEGFWREMETVRTNWKGALDQILGPLSLHYDFISESYTLRKNEHV
jgi:hypothetical protein